jgi:hypothetical protein
MGGAPPNAETIRQYQEAGVSRLVIAAAGSQAGDAVKAVRECAAVVETAARI